MHVLENDDFKVRDFLEYIGEHGIEEDDLIIGLLEKERELKSMGRFFAVCGFQLVTEHLIKK